MDRKKISELKDFAFAVRFTEMCSEICGSLQPPEIARVLDISYQAVRNYLNGRLPDASVLQKIAEKTDYSLSWLLTGKGEKFISIDYEEGTPILTDQMRALVRETCLEIISELGTESAVDANQTVVVLNSKLIKSEAAKTKTIDASDKLK